MMKHFTVKLLAIMLLASIATACGDDDPEVPATTTDNGVVDPNANVPDPTGTITLSMRDQDNGDTRFGINDYIYINDENFGGAQFASIGAVNGLGNVSYIPKAGWSNKVAVIPGNGYIAYIPKSDWYYHDEQWYRIYVIDYITNTAGGIMGADIKYHTPFKGVDEALSLETTTVTFSQEGGSQAVMLKNSNIIPFTVSSSAEWCQVSRCTTHDTYFLYNGVSITVDPSDSTFDTEAVVTLTTAHGKETTIKVTRLGNEPYISLESNGSVGAMGQDVTVTLHSNLSQISTIKLESDADWCTGEVTFADAGTNQSYANVKSIEGKPIKEYKIKSSSINTFNMTLHVTENDSETERVANITLSNGEASAKYQLTQKGVLINPERENFKISCNAGVNASLRVFSSHPYTDLITTVTSDYKTEQYGTEQWCYINPSQTGSAYSEYYGYHYYIIYDIYTFENPSSTEREATITLSTASGVSKNITITQQGASITASKNKLYFDRKQGNSTITISAPTTDYTPVSSDESWLTVSKNGYNLTIRVTSASENRTGTISFEGFPTTIEVNQSKYAVGDDYNENGLTGTVGYMADSVRIIYKDCGEAAWSTENVTTGATSEDNGMANMEIIKKIPNWQDLYPAFAAVEKLNTDGVTGWYLPASNELKSISSVLPHNSNTYYWSSCEYNSSYAYSYYTYSRKIRSDRSKSSTYPIFAIHKF